MDDFLNFIDKCKNKRVYIQTHNFPDPDAIASAYGLQKLLKYYKIESTLCYYGKIDKLSTKKMTKLFNIELFSYEEIEEDMKEDDYIICVDSQKNAGNILDFKGDEVACIDHHPTYVACKYIYSDIRIVGSCATLIAEYFKKLEVPMDSDVASALLYGIKMDTLQFSRGVTELDIEMFGFVFKKIDQKKLSELEKNTMELEDLKAYGAAIENILLYGTVGIAHIPFSCPDPMVAVVSDFILNLDEVEVAIIFSYREDGIKFSVRSEDEKIHAGDITNRALKNYGNGGGHATMAGGMISSENIKLLGKYPNEKIKELFFDAMKSEASH